MLRRFLVYTFIAALALGVFTSCNNDPEEFRSVVTVYSFNGNAPVIADVLDQGQSVIDDATGTWDTSDDGVAETWIPVQFYNRPYNGIVTTGPGAPHGEFLVTGYRIQWSRSDGGTPLPTYQSGTSIEVPAGELTDATMVLVTFADKSIAEISDLCYVCANAGGHIFMNAHITFYGHEVGTNREQIMETNTLVEFVDVIYSSGP